MSWVSKGFIIRLSNITVYNINYTSDIEVSIEIENNLTNVGCDTKLTLYKGDSHTIKVTAKDSNGDAINLTGFEVRFSVKLKESDGNYVFQKRNALAGGGITEIEMTDAVNGIFKVFIKPEDTTPYRDKISNYIYDIEIKQGSVVKTLIKDELLFTDDVTR